MLAAGDLFADRFEIAALAGKGGMGHVYRALDRVSGEAVALKLLTDEEGGERFSREARLLAQIRHPSIVRYVAHGSSEGRPFIAMEWVDGETLSRRLRRAPLADADAIAVVAQVARALSVAHAAGVVHRDVKPGNVILAGGAVDSVKLLDFGIAHVGESATLATQTGSVLGTVGYMSPEQARGVSKVDARADVFSLGVLLFHCLTGRTPFGGGPPVAVLAKLVLDEAPRLRSVRPELPASLDELLARLLAKEPSGRPADGAAVVTALSGIVLEETVQPSSGSSPDAEEALTGTEQRLVAVLLASGLVEEAPSEWGSTAFDDTAATEASEPSQRRTRETARAPGRIIRDLRSIAADYGAQVEPLRSGAVAVQITSVGAAAATDMVMRAARCALALRSLLPKAQMALATGRGVVAGALPVGDVIDRAGELVAVSPADGVGIAVDSVTRGLLPARFEVTDAAGLALLLGEREHSDATRRLLGKPTRTVGRERELGVVLGLLDECISEPVAHVALVVGRAGIGKSRLRYELLRRVAEQHDDVEIWSARGDPVGAGSPFGLLAQLIRRLAGAQDGEEAESSREKLRDRVARHVPPGEVPRVATFLAEVARWGADSTGDDAELEAARRDPVLMGDQMRRAWEDLVSAEASAHPLLIVLEDLHWGDLPTVSYVDSMLRVLEEAPILVLALARPEIRERFPSLWEQRSVHEVRLGGLSRKAAESLVREVLGLSVAPDLVQRLVARADGNAFYLEELIRAVAEGEADALPETVLAMVQSRLEALPDDARRVLRAASVLGGEFWDGAVAHLLGAEADPTQMTEWLRLLSEREVVTPRSTSRFPGSQQFVFRHALVRDAAYAMLTPEDRKRGHRLAGAWLEDNGEPDALVLASHFEEGNLAERAQHWCWTAAEEAFTGNDIAAARHALGRARELSRQCEMTPDVRGKMDLLEAEILYWSGQHADAQGLAKAATEALAPGSDEWFHATAVLMLASHRSGDTEGERRIGEMLVRQGHCERAGRACLLCVTRVAVGLVQIGEMELADRMFERFDRWAPQLASDPAAHARWQASLAVRALYAGEPFGYREMSRAASQGCALSGDLRGATLHRHNVAHACIELGAYEESEREFNEVMSTARRLGLANVEASAQNNLGAAVGRLGRLDEAKRLLTEAVARLEAQSDRRMEGGARNHLAEVEIALGEYLAAVSQAERAIEVLGQVAPLRVQARGTLARALLASGQVERALDEAAEANRELESVGSMADGEGAVRLVHVEALLAAGKRPEALRVLARAHDRLRRRARAVDDEAVRRSFTQRVAEHARTFELARELLGVS